MDLPDTHISAHLTWAEFLATSHREFLQEQRFPPSDVIANAFRFGRDLFEPARNIVGRLHVNSGYRCFQVNEAVGGASNSAHLFGRAADVVPCDVGLVTAFERLSVSLIPYDKLILEHGTWIHLQIAEKDLAPRREALMCWGSKGRAGQTLYPPYDPADPRVIALKETLCPTPPRS